MAERDGKREREGERETFFLIVHSSNGHNYQSPAGLKTGVRSSLWVSHLGVESQEFEFFSAAFPDHKQSTESK